jgi:hypothetical protein
MARETKVEREVRLQEEERASREAYPKRLMSALKKSLEYGFELSIKDMSFIIEYYKHHHNVYKNINIPLEGSFSNDTLEELEYELDKRDRLKEVGRQKAQLRLSAISKLTPEECGVLGIILK